MHSPSLSVVCLLQGLQAVLSSAVTCADNGLASFDLDNGCAVGLVDNYKRLMIEGNVSIQMKTEMCKAYEKLLACIDSKTQMRGCSREQSSNAYHKALEVYKRGSIAQFCTNHTAFLIYTKYASCYKQHYSRYEQCTHSRPAEGDDAGCLLLQSSRHCSRNVMSDCGQAAESYFASTVSKADFPLYVLLVPCPDEVNTGSCITGNSTWSIMLIASALFVWSRVL